MVNETKKVLIVDDYFVRGAQSLLDKMIDITPGPEVNAFYRNLLI